MSMMRHNYSDWSTDYLWNQSNWLSKNTTMENIGINVPYIRNMIGKNMKSQIYNLDFCITFAFQPKQCPTYICISACIALVWTSLNTSYYIEFL